MEKQNLFDDVFKMAESFGLKKDKNAVVRDKYTHTGEDDKAYFGFISEKEASSGKYSDLSLVIFPDSNATKCVVALGVGSLGFNQEYQMALRPGLRRKFLKLNQGKSYFKTNFADTEEETGGLFTEVRDNYPELKEVIGQYRNDLPAARIVDDLNSEKGRNVIYQWLAVYAKMRGWASNKKQREAINDVLKTIPKDNASVDKDNVKKLLKNRKYVVLQGAPGTGKTFTALEIAHEYTNKFLIQFHAETTYSDFVYGVEPKMDAKVGESQFKEKAGVLYEAIKAAQNTDKEVLLIIDEINRANLSNVLGPVFYLFEPLTKDREVEIPVGDLKLTSLPENLHVIATMNTADRSLAVVDFALRRRFAWYTLRPKKLEENNFDAETFDKFAAIFEEYATDEELNLQPGHSYFLYNPKDEEAKKYKMIYELMPLIKEYLAEGYLLGAKNEFCNLFKHEVGVLMYE